MYIPRAAEATLSSLATEFRAITVTGPRQSGKTTLVQHTFPDKPYVTFEDPDTREFAATDPRRFMRKHEAGAIFDEAQRCPEILSYLQGVIDQSPEFGRFVLTGSQHFGLMEQVSQTLAGRVGILHLLPLSLPELVASGICPDEIEVLLLRGGYPPLHASPATPERWYNAYINTYLERDMRQLLAVTNIGTFQRFMRLCAANIGQLVNLTRLGADCSVDQKTARAWLQVLETAFVCYRLLPHHANFRKRLVKAPKLYFHDTGLVARLLGIETAEQLSTHRMRGPLFENWVLTELLKGRFNRAKDDNLFFWRNNTGHEIDIIEDHAGKLRPIEVKSGMTITSDWLRGLEKWCALAGSRASRPVLIYGGQDRQSREVAEVVPWRDISEVL
jgi:predicted AAA+ superfamily ATPase